MQTATSIGATPAFRAELAADDFRVTAAASAKLAELIGDEPDVNAIRVFVSGGGCGGMKYGMTFTDARGEYDCVMKGDGFDIYIDAVALGYLRGVEIDFVERPSGASFVFNNAFSMTGGGGTCGGCGASGGGGGGCA